MRPLLIANIERIEETDFLVAQLFGDDGYLLDTVIRPYESAEVSISYVREFGSTYGIDTLEMWTSNREIYLAALPEIGIGAEIKHASDTLCTRTAAADLREILAEIDTEASADSPLPRWKAYVIGKLKGIIHKLGGYEQ